MAETTKSVTFFTNLLTGKKIASLLIPFIAGGLVVAAFVIGYNGCNTSKLQAVKDSVRSNDSNDSLLKSQALSFQNADTNLIHDTVLIYIARQKYEALQPAALIDNNFYLSKISGCDSLLNLYDLQVKDLQTAIYGKTKVIDLQNERLIGFSKNESLLHKLIDSTAKFSTPIQIPPYVNYGVELKAGSGFGALIALQAEGYIGFGKWKIFVQPAFLYQDKGRGYLIGGCSYNIFSN